MRHSLRAYLLAACALAGAAGASDCLARTVSPKTSYADRPKVLEIKSGTQWNWDNLDYTATAYGDSSASFEAMDEGQPLAFGMVPNPDPAAPNEYQVVDFDDDYYNAFSECPRVKQIVEDGMDLLCMYDTNGGLHYVLAKTKGIDGEELVKQKQTRRLMGQYTSKHGEPLTINADNTLKFGAVELPFRHITFNGTITGVIEIQGGTRLEGRWEAVITPDGLTLYKVKYDEYEKFKRTGEKETFKWARNDVPRFAFASSQLLNDNLLFRLDKATLRMMRNEILMHHGYKPSSTDLVEYLEGKEWFSPRPSNDDVFDELNLIEALNIELIKTEEKNRR